MKEVLQKLIAREDVSASDIADVTERIASGQADPVQTAAFLVLLAQKGETVEEIQAMVQVMRRHSLKVEVPYPVVDVVGTGGDGFHTVNISTAASILAAACGAKVAKHGSTSVSSKSGSSDVLQTLGVQMLDAPSIAQCIDEAGIAFMFAPKFHPAMKHVVPVRKALQVRTIFNIMGPLLNPAGARRMMLGVYTPDLLEAYGKVLHGLGVDHALVVCGHLNMDELNTIGPAQAVEVTPEKGVQKIVINPADFGLSKSTVEDLKGGMPEENAAIIRSLFSGDAKASGPLGDTIALNAGAALYVYGTATSIQNGFELAKAKLTSGEALAKLDEFVATTTKLSEDCAKRAKLSNAS